MRTLFGRKRALPELMSRNPALRQGAERMAVNTPIQGTAADLVKIAMIRVDRALAARGLDARLLLQVHDELVLEVAERDAEAVSVLVREEMGAAAELAVPLDVEVGVGPELGRGPLALQVAGGDGDDEHACQDDERELHGVSLGGAALHVEAPAFTGALGARPHSSSCRQVLDPRLGCGLPKVSSILRWPSAMLRTSASNCTRWRFISLMSSMTRT